jgi:peptidoglycan/LPS O-acetylase OafA/YrhL
MRINIPLSLSNSLKTLFKSPFVRLLKPLFHSLFGFVLPTEHTEVSKHYRPDIDGLRAFAVLSVVLYHYFPNLVKSGFVGVDIFFVISGYLIGGILLDSLQRQSGSLAKTNDLRKEDEQDRQSAVSKRLSFSTYLLDFYSRRVRRIFPALIVVMLFSLILGWFALLPDDYEILGKHTLGGAAFVSNIVLWIESWSDAGYWDVESYRKILLHLWSLGVEEQFYLCFPLALWFIYAKKLKTTIALIAIALISLAISLAAYHSHHFNIGFWTPAARFWELLIGSILAAYLRETNGVKPSDLALNLLSYFGFCLLIYSVFALSSKGFPGYMALCPTIATALLIYAGGFNKAKPVLISRLLSYKPIVGVGLISYPLYLWHWVLLSFAWIIVGGWDTKSYELATLRVFLIVIAIILSILTYYFVERPIRFAKEGRGVKTICLLIALMAIGGAGWLLYAKNGAAFERGGITMNDMRLLNEINAKASRWLDLTNEQECKQKFKATYYCQYINAGGAKTIALVGDSHAEVSFDTIAEFNKARGVNTLLLAAGGDSNPIIGDQAYTEETLNNLIGDQSIREVFIIIRGSVYMLGWDIIGGEYNKLGKEDYKNKLQYFVDRLNKANKQVYIVAENPELSRHIRYILPMQQFYKIDASHFPLKADVFSRQKIYLEILSEIKGATIIHTIDAFCPDDQCLILDANGLPIYRDGNHLSVNAGGRFLVEKVLKPYLDE